MPSPRGPLWKWDVSPMRTSQQAQLKYLCDCSSSVMNELIDFTLSCFFIDPAGPTVGKELCSSSSFPQGPVLFKARWKGFRAQNGNPKTSILDGSQMGHQAARWVWREGWELHLSATLRGSVPGGKWGWEVWCPNSASTSVWDCSRSLCGHLWVSRQPQFFPPFLIQIIFRESCQGLVYLSDSFPSIKSWCVQLFQSLPTAEWSWALHRWGRTQCLTREMADWAQQFEKFYWNEPPGPEKGGSHSQRAPLQPSQCLRVSPPHWHRLLGLGERS